MTATSPPAPQPVRLRATVVRPAGLRLVDLVGFVVVVGFVVYAFGAMDLDLEEVPLIDATMGRMVSPLLFVLSLGMLCIADSDRVKRMPISFPILLFVAFQVMSMAWTTNTGQWREGVVRTTLPGVAMIICAGIMDRRAFITSLLTGIRAVLAITVVSLVLFPDSTTFGRDEASNIQLGWHGLFLHKNVLSMFLVFALVTVLCLDRSKLLKPLTVIAIGVLLIGSSSTTGFAGVFVVLLMLAWLVIYRAIALHSGFLFGLVTFAGFVALVPILYGVLPTVVGWFGKDLTFSGRTVIWRASMNAFEGHEIGGYGLGGLWFDDGTEPTQNLRLDIGFRVVHAHNGAIELLIQLGIVGLVLYAAVWTATMISGAKLLRTGSSRLGMWMTAYALAVLMMGISENVFLGAWAAMLGVMRVMGLREEFAARDAGDEDQPTDDARTPVRAPTRPSALAGV